jgi:hypothetical protein
VNPGVSHISGVGEKSQTELECSRCVVLISKFRAFVALPAHADSRRDGSKPQGLHHKAMRRPEDRRILNIGQSEWLLLGGNR